MKMTIKDLSNETITAYSTSLRGNVVLPSDAEYGETCKIYNGMIHKHPGMFAMCVDVADVIASVNFARENNLLLAIRGGGHNGGGLGLCDDGLVIDLSGLKFVRVDTA
ncbi:MAG: FAD-binding protein, partial [Muriicola sp.]|nr:FAD-binding protein [Muriicola sp.]